MSRSPHVFQKFGNDDELLSAWERVDGWTLVSGLFRPGGLTLRPCDAARTSEQASAATSGAMCVVPGALRGLDGSVH